METKKFSGSLLPEYKKMVENFDGVNLLSSELISEDEFTSFIFGLLVKKAGKFLNKEIPNFDNRILFEKLILKANTSKGVFIDVKKSLQKRDFVRVACDFFNDKEKHAYSLLILYEYTENCDMAHLETQFYAGFFSNFEIK